MNKDDNRFLGKNRIIKIDYNKIIIRSDLIRKDIKKDIKIDNSKGILNERNERNSLAKLRQVNNTNNEYYFMITLLYLLGYNFDFKFKKKPSSKSIQFLKLNNLSYNNQIIYNEDYFNNLKDLKKNEIENYFKNENKNISKTYLKNLVGFNMETINYNLIRSILEKVLYQNNINFQFKENISNKSNKKLDFNILKNRFDELLINNKSFKRNEFDLIGKTLYDYLILNKIDLNLNSNNKVNKKKNFQIIQEDLLFKEILKGIELDQNIFNTYWFNIK